MGKYPEYMEYKDSGIEWLGKVPLDWNVKRLKDIATYNDESLDEKYDPDYEIEYVDISSVNLVQGITTKESMIFEKAPSRARRKVKDGDTIVSTVRTYLKAIAAIRNPPSNMIVSTGFAVIRPKVGLCPNYIGYLLQSEGFIGDVVANSVGVSYPAINASDLVRIPVVEPSLPEQRTIARFLDHKTAQIDALIAKKEALLAKLAEKRTALIRHAVTKGLDPTVPMKDSGIEWLGEIPTHWDTPSLSTRYSSELGKMLNESRISGEYLIPYLKNVDVQWDFIKQSDLPLMDIHPKEYDRYLVKPGDILVCEGGEVGRAAIVPKIDYLLGFQKAIHRLRAQSTREVPRFLFYTLYWASHIGVFVTEGNPNTIAHLTGEKLRRYKFPTPSFTEQLAIVQYLDKQTELIDQQQARIQKAIDKLKEYRTALITNAVTGKIDVRNVPIPASTPAEAAHVS